MQAIELPAELTVRFKASVHHKPADRAFTREWLASAMQGVPVEVVDGFTTIEPLPRRIEPKKTARRKARADRGTYVAPVIMTEAVAETVGGYAALARHLGVTYNAISKWNAEVPSRHELKVRELLRHWKKIERAKALFSVGLKPVIVSRQIGIPLEELFDLCERFNVSTNE